MPFPAKEVLDREYALNAARQVLFSEIGDSKGNTQAFLLLMGQVFIQAQKGGVTYRNLSEFHSILSDAAKFWWEYAMLEYEGVRKVENGHIFSKEFLAQLRGTQEEAK